MKSTTNILIITDCFSDTTAGAEKQIFELTRGLTQPAYKVIIVSLDHCSPTVQPAVEAIGARLEVLRVRRIYGVSGLLQGIRLFKLIKREKIDIVQTYHFGSDIWGAVIGRLAGVKAIISNRRDMGFWRKDIHIQAYRLVNRWVKKVVVNANSIKTMVMQTEGVPGDKIQVIYNGVEFDYGGLTPVTRASLGLDERDLVLMHVANLKPVKGHIFLFEALKSISATHPNVKLVVIGEDLYDGFLQKKSAEMGLEGRIIFLGKRKDVGPLLALSDICVLPSLSEGLSNAILEYMVAAKPVVATRVGGNPELIEDGKTGFLVDKEDSTALAQAISKLIVNKDLRLSLGQNGRRKAVEHFSVAAMVGHYQDLFASLLGGKTRVLHFISSGGFFGAENVLLTIAKNFNNEKYHSCVSAIRDARSAHLEIIERARTLNLPAHVFESKGRMDFQTVGELRKFLRDHKIDILHTHNYKSDIIGALAVNGTGAALVATAHGFTDMNGKVSWYEHLDRWFLKNFFSKTIVVAERMLPGFPPHKKRVIANGIDFAKFTFSASNRREIRRRYNIGDNDVLIGTVGRLSIEKDQALLISAVKDICLKNPRVKLMIIGDGPQKEELDRQIKDNRLSGQVILTGLIANPAPFYQAFDLFVLSSRTEGVPLTLLEAMASRVAVIATKVGGIPQIVSDGQTGLLVDPQNAAQLRRAVESLVDDPQKRRNFHEAAFGFAHEHYSMDRMNTLYHAVYQEVLSP